MSKLTLAGIRRGNQFSPNHIGNDAAIFALTAQHLRKLGCDVNEYIESVCCYKTRRKRVSLIW